MSRYSIRVHRDGDAPREHPCDSVYVDDGGDLHVNRNQRPSDDLLTIARFQHGHWSSYELEPSNEAAAEERLRLGAIMLDEFAKRISGDADASADVPVKAERLPMVGETVHLVTFDGHGCTPAKVFRPTLDGFVVVHPIGDPTPWPREVRHDESRQSENSWHWPCEGDGRDAEPERPLEPTTVTIELNISGGCTIDPADLQAVISRYMLDRR